MKIVDALTKRQLPRRTTPVVAVVLHTTGATNLDKILAFYQSASGLQPHYLVADDGTIYRTAEEHHVAYHCKIGDTEAGLYQLGYPTWSKWTWEKDRPVDHGGEQPNYRQWRDDWVSRGVLSPLGLVTGGFPNFRSIGIEIQALERPTKRVFNDVQYETTAKLVKWIGRMHGVPVVRERILGHYDCNPMKRSSPNGSTDPGRSFDWLTFFDLMPLREIV